MASEFTYRVAASTLPVFTTGPPPAQARETRYCHALTSWSPICPRLCGVSLPRNCYQEGAALSMGQPLVNQRQTGGLLLSEKIPNRWWDTLLSDEAVEYHTSMPSLQGSQPIFCLTCLSTAWKFFLSYLWRSLFTYLCFPLYIRKEIAGSYSKLTLSVGHSSFSGCLQASRVFFKATSLYSVLWLPTWWV